MISVRAIGLGKAYRSYRRPLDSLRELLTGRTTSETFWALRDVTFEVLRGGSLGIVGDNGAGKSTLLKLLARAIAPSSGQVELAGRVAGLLNLDAGFHTDLTGWENIRIGCAVLGLSPAETEGRLTEIAEFSELGAFLDRPVRTYSSGMHLRLGFSVATAVQPEILVVDEHLAVGDQHFRHKCLRRIMALREAGCTLIFCSHDLHSVREVCERTLWLHEAHPMMLASTTDVLKAYEDHARGRDAATIGQATAMPGVSDPHPDAHIRDIALVSHGSPAQVRTGDRVALRIIVHASDAILRDGAHVVVLIVRNDAVWCYGTASDAHGPFVLRPLGDGGHGITFVIDELPLLSGQYSFTVALMDDRSPHAYDYRLGACPFTVRHAGQDVGVMRIAHHWERP